RAGAPDLVASGQAEHLAVHLQHALSIEDRYSARRPIGSADEQLERTPGSAHGATCAQAEPRLQAESRESVGTHHATPAAPRGSRRRNPRGFVAFGLLRVQVRTER